MANNIMGAVSAISSELADFGQTGQDYSESVAQAESIVLSALGERMSAEQLRQRVRTGYNRLWVGTRPLSARHAPRSGIVGLGRTNNPLLQIDGEVRRDAFLFPDSVGSTPATWTWGNKVFTRDPNGTLRRVTVDIAPDAARAVERAQQAVGGEVRPKE